MKHYKPVDLLSIFRMSSPRTNAKPPYWKLSSRGSLCASYSSISTTSPILPKWNKSLNAYVRSGMASPKFSEGQNV